MIKLELYPLEDTPPRIGTVYHSRDGVAVAMRQEYKCKADIRRYLCGLEPANYPVPAIPLVAVWQDEPWFANTVRIESIHDDERVIEAIYDENWDRCMDFNVPYAQFYSTQNYFSI